MWSRSNKNIVSNRGRIEAGFGLLEGAVGVFGARICSDTKVLWSIVSSCASLISLIIWPCFCDTSASLVLMLSRSAFELNSFFSPE